MVFLPLVPNSSTWVLFLRCDSGGQVGRPCPQGQRPVPQFRSNIPVLVSTVEDQSYLLTRDLPNGFLFLRFLGFVCVTRHNFARKLPFKMVTKDYRWCTQPIDKKQLPEHRSIFSKASPVGFELKTCHLGGDNLPTSLSHHTP